MAMSKYSQVEYQCCFCGKGIERKPPDVAALEYTTCTDRPKMQHSQTMFCHTTCLRERLHSSVNLYAVDLLEFASGKPESEGYE